ncbi:MAG: glycosyltransferase [Leptospira sp.]|nr:glycosyltransferase [Leptospira sp.]
MKITVITVCFNSVETIKDAIDSVQSQTYPEIEHLVIDGGSSDGTAEILRSQKSGNFRFVSEPDRGIYDAMNKGIGLAKGDVIGFLNADDVFADRESLSKIAECLKTNKVDSCYSDLVYMNRELTKIIRFWKSEPYREGLFNRGWMPAHPTFYVRKEIFERFGSFDLQFSLAADFELTMRFLAINKISSFYIPEVLVKMRVGGATNKGILNVIKGNLESYRACKKNNLQVSRFFVLQKIFSRIPQFFLK